MCKTISPFFYYSELKRYERKKKFYRTPIVKNIVSVDALLKHVVVKGKKFHFRYVVFFGFR